MNLFQRLCVCSLKDRYSEIFILLLLIYKSLKEKNALKWQVRVNSKWVGGHSEKQKWKCAVSGNLTLQSHLHLYYTNLEKNKA